MNNDPSGTYGDLPGKGYLSGVIPAFERLGNKMPRLNGVISRAFLLRFGGCLAALLLFQHAAVAGAGDWTFALKRFGTTTKKAVFMSPQENLSLLAWSIPNFSYGSFTDGLTVSYSGTTGYVSGSTGAFLLMEDSAFKNYALVFEMAIYDKKTHGFECYAVQNSTTRSGLGLSGTTSFPDTDSIDLQVDQTARALTFYARATPAGTGVVKWTTIYSGATPATPTGSLSYFMTFGEVNMKKGTGFYFNRFYVDGIAVGGQTEGPIVADLRHAAEASGTAEADLQETPAKFAEATDSINVAISANKTAASALQTAIGAGTLQSPAFGKGAEQTLQSVQTLLQTVHAAVAQKRTAGVSTDLANLRLITGDQEAVMAEMMGFKIPSQDPAIPNLIYLKAP